MKVINLGKKSWKWVVCDSCKATLDITEEDIYRHRDNDDVWWYDYMVRCVCGSEINLHSLPDEVKRSALPQYIFEMKPKMLSLRNIEDFPKPGILFKDISPLLATPKEMKQLITYLSGYWKGKVHKIGGFDARGFIFGSLLSYEMNLPFFMLRKKGKLPGACNEVSYDLEYGSASLEVQADAVATGDKVLLIDDLLATGGTALAGCQLVERSGAEVVGVQFIIELGDLSGRKVLGNYNIQSIITC